MLRLFIIIVWKCGA